VRQFRYFPPTKKAHQKVACPPNHGHRHALHGAPAHHGASASPPDRILHARMRRACIRAGRTRCFEVCRALGRVAPAPSRVPSARAQRTIRVCGGISHSARPGAVSFYSSQCWRVFPWPCLSGESRGGPQLRRMKPGSGAPRRGQPARPLARSARIQKPREAHTRVPNDAARGGSSWRFRWRWAAR
jgi:hypothetical protein